MKNVMQCLKDKFGFLKPIIRWLMVEVGLVEPEPTYVFPEQVFPELEDEEYWKTIPKSDQMEYVPESELEEDFRKEYPDIGNDEDREYQ